MRTKTVNLYEFKELSDEMKEKALNELWDINVNYDWWEFDYEDASRIGLKINGFDLEKRTIEGEFITSAGDTLELIGKEHGEDTDTYKTMIRYADSINHGQDEELMNSEHEFLTDLLEDYLVLLQKEWDYRTIGISQQILFSEVVLQACYAEYFGKFSPKQKVVIYEGNI